MYVIPESSVVSVHYTTFVSILSNLGGLASSIKIILVIVLTTYTQRTYLKALSKRIQEERNENFEDHIEISKLIQKRISSIEIFKLYDVIETKEI